MVPFYGQGMNAGRKNIIFKFKGLKIDALIEH